jgi:hypothetical protein
MLPVQGTPHVKPTIQRLHDREASLGLSLCRNLYSHGSRKKISVPTLKVVIRVMVFSLLTLVAFGYVLCFLPYRSKQCE